jgi:hypothetical protein
MYNKETQKGINRNFLDVSCLDHMIKRQKGSQVDPVYKNVSNVGLEIGSFFGPYYVTIQHNTMSEVGKMRPTLIKNHCGISILT